MAREVKAAIIGAGPAGIAAGIFLQRVGLAPLVLEKDKPGGLLKSANLVENYPGFPTGISGRDLVARFKSQMKRVGLKVTRAQVERVTRLKGSFVIDSDARTYRSRSLIVATGTRPVDTALRGAQPLMRSRVFSEITDIPGRMWSGNRALVIGGGDAAFDYAINLTEAGDEVTILSRSTPRCIPLLKERARRLGVKIFAGCEASSVSTPGEDGIVCQIAGSTRQLDADFVLMACGRVPNIEFLDPTLRKSIGKRTPETAVPGLFIAGDVASGNHRQTGIAVGDGIRSAMLVHDFLETKGGCD